MIGRADRRCHIIGVLVLITSGIATPCLAVPTIDVGTHYLLPDTPDQVIELYVTGGDDVEGLDLYVIVANGGPELETLGFLEPGTGIVGPAITGVDILTGTIFADNNIGQIDGGSPDTPTPQVAIFITATETGTVIAEGLLARITIDTTGFTGGTYDLSLSLPGLETDFGAIAASIVNGQIILSDGAAVGATQLAVDAGQDQAAATASQTVELTATITADEGAALTYTWTQTAGPEVTLAGADTATPSFTAPTLDTGADLTFQVEVSDGTDTITDTVTVAVAATQLNPDTTATDNTSTDTTSSTASSTDSTSTNAQDALVQGFIAAGLILLALWWIFFVLL